MSDGRGLGRRAPRASSANSGKSITHGNFLALTAVQRHRMVVDRTMIAASVDKGGSVARQPGASKPAEGPSEEVS